MTNKAWTGRRVFITGADGFIGSHLTEALVRAGAEVTALACYNSFDSHGWLDDLSPDVLRSIQLARGDIRDPHQMAQLSKNQDVIFHLAALIAIPYSYEAPRSYIETNINGTVNVLMAAREANVGRVVHTSTSEVYGTAIYTPIDEAHPLQGQSPYSASKAAGDLMAESFHKSFELPIVILRPFNTYGPRQSERAVIPTIIRQVIDPACDVIRVGDLSPKRDFNFVEDTVAAFIAAAILPDTANGEVFNAGSGHMVTIEETLAQIIELTGSTKNVVREEKRVRPEKSEVLTLMANTEKLKAISPWRPETDLSQGLQKTIDWWSERINNLRPSSEYMR